MFEVAIATTCSEPYHAGAPNGPVTVAVAYAGTADTRVDCVVWAAAEMHPSGFETFWV